MLVTEFNSKFSSLSEKQVEKGYMNSHLSLIKKGEGNHLLLLFVQQYFRVVYTPVLSSQFLDSTNNYFATYC